MPNTSGTIVSGTPAGGSGGGPTSFADITSGNNITATMIVDSGAILGYSGTGILDANDIGGINVAGNTPTHAGQLLISQPGNTTAVWADPLIQGLYPDGTLISTPINPVYVGAQSVDGKLYGLMSDGSKNLLVSIASGSVTVSGSITVANPEVQFTDGEVMSPPMGNLAMAEYAGTAYPIQLDAADGNLKVVFSNSTIGVTNVNLDAKLSDIDSDIKSNITLHAGTNVIGKVSQDTNPWIVAGNLSEGATISTANVGALVAHASPTRQVHANGKQYLLNMDLEGYLRTRTRSENMLGDVSIAPRNNQIELNFSIAFASLPVANTPTGTGSASQSGGQAIYSSGGTSGGRSIGQSTQALVYRPGHEYYTYLTALFSTGGTGAGFQRVGMYNATDGFWLGYEGSTFGLTQFLSGSPTQIAKASWNGDPLDGSANSSFTSAGSPVAINLQKINIYRIHGSWFGSAPVRLEVLSPDSEWVLCHTFLFPNTLTAPYAGTTNWNLTVDVQSASATPVSISVPCMAAGTQDQNFGITDAITDNSLAVLGRSVIVGKQPAGTYANVGVSAEAALNMSGSGATSVSAATWTTTTGGGGTALNTALVMVSNSFAYNTIVAELVGAGTISAGAVTFEGSIDNSNWIAIFGVNIGTGATFNGIFTLATGANAVLFNIAGFNYFRVRLSTQITGTGGSVVISYNKQGLASPNVSSTTSSGTIHVNGDQGTPNSIGNAWPVYVTDANSHALTVNSTTPTAHYALDTNITSILGTAPTTAGFLDIKGADGNVFVRQATASNLNATVVGTGTFAVQSAATLGSETTKVIGTVRTLGNVGGVMDTTLGSTKPANALQVSGNDGTNAYAIPLAAGGGSVVVSGSVTVPTHAITIASGGVASGAFASGSIASGAVVDGAIVTLGLKTDAAATQTDTTSVSIVSILKEISAKEQAPVTRAVTIISGGVASGAIASGAIASGAVASGAVASGAFAAGAISDGADVTQGTKTDAKSTATDGTSVSIMSVLKQISASVQAPPSQAVTNAGTFAVQATTKTALTPSAPAAATVGAASAVAVSANANRKGLVLVNTSVNYISLAFNAAAVLYSGITLAPYGTFTMDEYMFSTLEVRAIASAAASNLAVQEWTT